MEQLSRTARFWQWWAAISLRRPLLVTLLGVLAFVASVPFAARLYGDLRTDLRELLPQGAPAAVALAELEKRIGGLSHLAIVVRTDDLRAGARDALRAQIAKANPLLIDLAEESDLPPAVIDLEEVVGRIKAAYAKLDRFPEGYLAGENGHTLVMLVSPPGAAVSLEDDQRIFNAVHYKVKDLNPKSFHPSIEIGYGGEIRGVIEAQEALVRDLALSSTLTLSAVSLALILYYRTMRAVPLLVVPLFTGVALTFALSRGVIHYLNPNTAFLGSIIIGNGINAGIILLARYLEERRRGTDTHHALRISLRSTWIATFAASAAAAASYGSLGAVRFRGFNQFAFMGFCGMVICWLTTYALMPALIGLQERYWPFGNLTRPKRGRVVGWLMGPFAQVVMRRPAVPVMITLALGGASLYAGWLFAQDPIQYDFTKLGSRSGEKWGHGYWDKHVDNVLQSYQTPTVILTGSPKEAEAVAEALEKQKREEGADSTIDSVV